MRLKFSLVGNYAQIGYGNPADSAVWHTTSWVLRPAPARRRSMLFTSKGRETRFTDFDFFSAVLALYQWHDPCGKFFHTVQRGI